MKLLEAIDMNYDGELRLDTVYSVALVANTLEHTASVVRGIAAENIDSKELSSSFFSDIDEKIKEYENLADHQIVTTLAPATALRQFVHTWPEHVVLVTTNATSWLTSLLNSLDDEFELFKGRTREVIDLGRLASVSAATQLKKGKSLSDVLPVNRFNTRTGSLARLADEVGVSRSMFVAESVYCSARARMLAEAFRRYLDREIEDT